METSEALRKAIQYHQTGNLIEAEKIYKDILAIDDNNFYALNYLGALYCQIGNYDNAINYINKALQIYPDAHAYYNLGLAYQGKKFFDKAISSYKKALNLDPNMADAWVNLGIIFFKNEMQTDDALKCFKEALRIKPNHTEAYNNLGIILRQKGQLEEATECYQKAIQLNPEYPDVLLNLAIVLQESGKLEEAITYYKKALNYKPGSFEILFNLGTALMEEGKQDEALSIFNEIIKLKPYSFIARFAHCIAQIPIIHQDESSIHSSRRNYQNELIELKNKIDLRNSSLIEEASLAIGTMQPFYLAYQGLNDVELQRPYGELICSIMSQRYPEFSNYPHTTTIKKNEPIRIGFVSGYFYNHSVWKIPIKGWVDKIDKERFELYGYYTWIKIDDETKAAENYFKKFVKNNSFEKLNKLIHDDNLHIIIYPEIGMDPLSLKLASLKLAPVQCVSWGHPTTTGLPTIDYFLSSDLMEPDNANEHYTEKLVRLPNLSAYLVPTDMQMAVMNRKTFNLPENSILYHCNQSLYKFLPQYDEIFPLIAKRVNNCRFLFSAHPKSKYITEQFRLRLYRAFDRLNLNASDYIVFLPFLDNQRYNSLYQISDVFLDPIGWSGCNSAIEAINFNLPIITFQGSLMRSRDGSAILKMMGIEECIASSIEDYIDLAIQIGNDKEYRRIISKKIAENKYKIFYDMECITALENFIEKVVK